MKDRQRNQCDAFTRVRAFGVQNPTHFPVSELTGELMAIISAAVDDVNRLAATHTASVGTARQSRGSRASLRAALIDDLRAINRTARAMAERTPGVDAQFRLGFSNDQELLALARAFVKNGTALQAEFIRFGMAADFIDDLLADINEYEQLNVAHSQSREAQAASIAGIDDVMERALSALRQLDAIMRNVLRNDAQMLAAWIAASHIERPRKSGKPSPAKPSPPPPAAPEA